MTEDESRLILAYLLQEITLDDLIAGFGSHLDNPGAYVAQSIKAAILAKNATSLSSALSLGYIFGFNEESVPPLLDALIEDWHDQYDEIASNLQQLRPQSAVEPLFEAITTEVPNPDYVSVDVYRQNCIWALYDIGTEESKQKLEILARTGSDHVREVATERLDKWDRSGGRRFIVDYNLPPVPEPVTASFRPGQSALQPFVNVLRISASETEALYRYWNGAGGRHELGEFVFVKNGCVGRLTNLSMWCSEVRLFYAALAWVGERWLRDGFLP